MGTIRTGKRAEPDFMFLRRMLAAYESQNKEIAQLRREVDRVDQVVCTDGRKFGSEL